MGISNTRAAANRRSLISALRGGLTFGDVFYVDSTNGAASDTAGRGKTLSAPFATLDFAVGQCAVNNDDVIILAPGHAETIIAENDVDIDVAGVTVVGIGRGTDRPTFNFTTNVAADFKLAAANVRVENILFTAGIDALTAPIEISGAFCELVDCEFQDGTTGSIDTACIVDVLATGDSCLIDGFVSIGNDDEGGGDAIICCIRGAVGATDFRVMNCFITGGFTIGCLDLNQTTDLIRIGPNNHLINTNDTDTCIDVLATSSGTIFLNYMETDGDAVDTAVTVDNDLSLLKNLFVNLDGQTGGIVGTPHS